MKESTQELHSIFFKLMHWIDNQKKSGDKEAARRAHRAQTTLHSLYDDMRRLEGWNKLSDEEKGKYQDWANSTGLDLGEY